MKMSVKAVLALVAVRSTHAFVVVPRTGSSFSLQCRRSSVCSSDCPASVRYRRSAIAVASSNGTDVDTSTVINDLTSGGDVEQAEAELRRMLRTYRVDGDMSFKPSPEAFECVILALLRQSYDDGLSPVTIASIAARAESLVDDMELMYQPNGVLYRKLINVWCAVAMREDLDAPSTMQHQVEEVEGTAVMDDLHEDTRGKSFDRAKRAARHSLEILDRMEQLFIETGNDDMMPGVTQYKNCINAWKLLGSDEADDVIRRVVERRDKLFSRAGVVPNSTPKERIHSHKDVLQVVRQLNSKDLSKRLVYRRYGRKVQKTADGSEVVIDNGYPGVVTSTHNYNIIIDALAKSGNPWAGLQAEAILEYMVDQYQSSQNSYIKPNAITVNSCINAWAQSSTRDSAPRAEAILDKVAAWRHDGKLKDVNADASSYNSIIKAWSLSRNGGGDAARHAERILERMEKDPRVTPDEISYSSVLNAYAKHSVRDNRAADKAEQLLLRMYQEHKSHPEKNVAPNVRCFNAALDAHSNSRDRSSGRRALKLLSLMEDMSKTGNSNILPDVWSFNLAIKALSKGGDRRSARQALELLDRMEKWSMDGNERIAPDNVTFNTVINAFARSRTKGSAETAEELYYRMKELEKGGKSSVKPDAVTLASVVNAWAISDDTRSSGRRAIAIFEDAKENGVIIDTVAYNALLNCLAKSGSRQAPDRAEAVLREMEYEYARGNTNAKPDVISYTSTISALARSRDSMAPKRAMTILARMEAEAAGGDDKIRPNAFTYSAAIRVWARSRDKNKAQQAQNLLNWMEEQYRRGNGSARPTCTSYNLVLNACAYTAASEDTKTMEEAFKIACLTFEELRTSPYLKPSHMSYANFLEVVGKLMPEGELHDKLIDNIFRRSCRDGVVSNTVIRRLRGAGSSHLFKTLLDGERVSNLPQAWTRNL